MRALPERVYFKHGAYYYVTPEVLSTMNRVFDKYVKEVIPTKAPRTQSDNLKEMKNLRPVFGDMRPMDVKPRHITQYLALRTAKVRGNREIALLQHVFKKALNWGVVEFNPCRGIERNPEYPRDRYVSTLELKALQACCPEWLALYLELKYITGLRQSDLLKLRLEDFGPTGLSLTIAKTGRGAQRRGQQRVLFKMNPALHSLWKRF